MGREIGDRTGMTFNAAAGEYMNELEETIVRLNRVLAEAIADNTRLEIELARLQENEDR